MSPGPPVVSCMEFASAGRCGHPVMERIGRDHPTVAPDLPGHGTRRGEIFTADGAVDAVAAAIPGRGHVTTLAERARLARIVQDAAIVAAASEH